MTQAFNLSQLANFVNTSGQLNAATGLFNQVPVANGGTGKSSVTTGALLLGAGTSAMTELTGTTPGTVVAASPTGWTSVPSTSLAAGNYILNSYTSPTTWDYTTKLAAGLKAVKVQVVGGGGNGGATPNANNNPGSAGGGGGGGSSIRYLPAPAIGAPVTITAGPGVNSFGAFVSATGGSNAPSVSGGVAGPGGAAGVGSSGLINLTGIAGSAAPGVGLSGGGGSGAGFYQFPVGPGRSSSGPGNPAVPTNYGSGGGGASKGTGVGPFPGGTGAPGIVIVEEFY